MRSTSNFKFGAASGWVKRARERGGVWAWMRRGEDAWVRLISDL